MKYVIFKTKVCYMPVVFPDHIAHSQVHIDGCAPLSAGFITRDGHVTGESVSLHLKSRPEDEAILARVFADCGTSSFLNYEDPS